MSSRIAGPFPAAPRAGSWLVVGFVVLLGPMLLVGSCEDVPGPSVPVRLAPVSGDNQIHSEEGTLPEPLVARVTDARGSGVADIGVEWTIVEGRSWISPTSSTTDAAGYVEASWTPVTLGEHRVQVTAADLTPIFFGATRPIVTSLTASPLGASMLAGDTVRFKAIALDSITLGPLIADVAIAWTTSDPGIARVDSSGLVRAVAKGWTYLIASAQEKSDTIGIAVVEPLRLVSLDAGGDHGCGTDGNGAAYCWGKNSHGQLGGVAAETCSDSVNTWPCSTTPAVVAGGLAFTRLSAGLRLGAGLYPHTPATGPSEEHSCGLTADGAAYCWGYNGHGQLGDGSVGDSETPAPVSGGLAFTAISAGGMHTCGLVDGGVAYCWGRNDSGQLGDSTFMDRATPVRVASELVFADISAGFNSTCAIVAGGQAYCWGSSESGKLGAAGNYAQFTGCDPTPGGYSHCSTTPVPVSGGLHFVAVAAGSTHTCGVTTGGEGYCWGSTLVGALGNGIACCESLKDTDRQGFAFPQLVLGGLVFTSIDAGHHYSCGLTVDGEAYCWGGVPPPLQEGPGRGRSVWGSVPRRVPGGLRFTTIHVGSGHTCGLAVEGITYCWGDATFGQLGDGLSNYWRELPGPVSVPR